MRITKYIATALILVLAVPASTAYAHVLIKDESNKVGAIFHVTPDDDPVAGESSTLYFDVQKKGVDTSSYDYKLIIQDENGATLNIPLELAGSTATANYIFPKRGLYALTISLEPNTTKDRPINFKYSQRVARGIAGSTASKQAYPGWAEPLLLLSVVGLAVVFIIAFNKRTSIVSYSKF